MMLKKQNITALNVVKKKFTRLLEKLIIMRELGFIVKTAIMLLPCRAEVLIINLCGLANEAQRGTKERH